MSLTDRLALTALVYAALILGTCLSLWLGQVLPPALREVYRDLIRRWRGGDEP